jgi:hypothetical protein
LIDPPPPPPANDFGITKDVGVEISIKELLRLASESADGVVSYAQVRTAVGSMLHISEADMQTPAWRVWFRDFLDSLCEAFVFTVNGSPVYFAVIGVDAATWSPLLQAISAAAEDAAAM